MGELRYYQKKTGQEIDFILNGQTAIEVKESALPQDYQVLQQRANSISLKEIKLVGRYPPKSDFKDFIWGGIFFSGNDHIDSPWRWCAWPLQIVGYEKAPKSRTKLK